LTKPKTSWTYELGGDYLSLTGQIGTIKGRADGRTTVLEVYGDGELLFRSAPLDSSESKPLFVDLRGVNVLNLNALDAGGAKMEDLVLGDPVLTKAPATDTPPEGVSGKCRQCPAGAGHYTGAGRSPGALDGGFHFRKIHRCRWHDHALHLAFRGWGDGVP